MNKRFAVLSLILVLSLVMDLPGCAPKSATDQAIDQAIAKGDIKPADQNGGIEIDKDATVAYPAPALEFKTLDGKSVKLADYKGKVVLIDFWATWCPPCKKGLPFTNRMSQELKDRGLQVLAISNEPANVIKAFVKEYKYTFDVFSDEQDAGASAFSFNGIPTTVIIDKAGNVVAKEIGLYPQARTIANLQKAGLDVTGFNPKDDPTAG